MGVGVVAMGPSGIVMDTSKAMAILGFTPSQTFESTPLAEMNRSFMYKMHLLQTAGTKANKRKTNPRKKDTRNNEMRKLNEALQYLTRKKTKSKAMQEWKKNSRKANVVLMAIEGLCEVQGVGQIDTASKEKRDEEIRKKLQKEQESKRAQALANELISSGAQLPPGMKGYLGASSVGGAFGLNKDKDDAGGDSGKTSASAAAAFKSSTSKSAKSAKDSSSSSKSSSKKDKKGGSLRSKGSSNGLLLTEDKLKATSATNRRTSTYSSISLPLTSSDIKKAGVSSSSLSSAASTTSSYPPTTRNSRRGTSVTSRNKSARAGGGRGSSSLRDHRDSSSVRPRTSTSSSKGSGRGGSSSSYLVLPDDNEAMTKSTSDLSGIGESEGIEMVRSALSQLNLVQMQEGHIGMNGHSFSSESLE